MAKNLGSGRKKEKEQIDSKLDRAYEMVGDIAHGLDVLGRLVETASDCPYLKDREIREGTGTIMVALGKQLHRAANIIEDVKSEVGEAA